MGSQARRAGGGVAPRPPPLPPGPDPVVGSDAPSSRSSLRRGGAAPGRGQGDRASRRVDRRGRAESRSRRIGVDARGREGADGGLRLPRPARSGDPDDRYAAARWEDDRDFACLAGRGTHRGRPDRVAAGRARPVRPRPAHRGRRDHGRGREREGAARGARHARGARAADRRARPWSDSGRPSGADRPDARLHAAAPRRDAPSHRAAPLAQSCTRLAAARRRGTHRLPAAARAPQCQPGIPRGGEGNDGTRAMMPLLLWAALAQAPRLTSNGELAALFAQRDSDVTVIDVRDDYTRYLESHIPRAVYLHVEELRAAERGVPNKLLGLVSYTALFSRLGLRPDRPVVIYSAGETRDIDATYLAWILEGLGHPRIQAR